MHFMLDLETLSTAHNAVVTQIGLVAFDENGVSTDGLRVNVDPEQQIMSGRDVSWSTIDWWLKQSDDARRALTLPSDRTPLTRALVKVSDYLEKHAGRDFWKRRVWSNGAGFDVPILEGAYRYYRIQCPWNFSRVRDVRTMAALCPGVKRPDPEIAHDALYDAIAQAEWMIACSRELGVWPK